MNRQQGKGRASGAREPGQGDAALARMVVDAAIDRYIAGCRDRVPGFVARHFSLWGSLALHRCVLGWDLLRAPLNLLAGVATAVTGIVAGGAQAMGARRLGQRLRETNLFLPTALGRELDWRLHTELLRLPVEQPGRRCQEDALLCEVLRDPRLLAALGPTLRELEARRGSAAGFGSSKHAYIGARAAASDLAVNASALAVGWGSLQTLTPGVAGLGVSMAGSLAHAAAVNSFWAGPTLGGFYYALVGVTAPPLLIAGVVTGLLLPVALLSAFAGIVTDPLQRRLGVHQRRLNRLLDSVEGALRAEGDAGLRVRDHYVARVLDLLDWAHTAARLGP